ncbi:MAG: NADP-dependent oxidoreductase [Alphaproteobacteria bacterium]
MSNQTNRRIVMAARPEGAPQEGDFRLEEAAIAEPGAGEILCRTLYLSLDPYMRGRMNAAKSYAPRVEVGELMVGGAVSEVLRSRAEGFEASDIVFGYTGWQDYWTSEARGVQGLRKVDPALAPISTALGVLGMPGMTAYTGLYNIGQPRAGETLVVAAAAGPVGSLVGQIAKIEGLRAVGIAGSAEKCAYVTGELGFDACLNHREAGFAEALAAACPEGIDIYWENVGGAVFEAVLPLLNRFARVPVCGLVAQYNAPQLKAGEPPPGPNRIPQLMRAVLTDRLLIRGFIVWDYADQEDEFRDTVTGWLRDGRIKYREDIVDGLENAPRAFQGLLQGKNFGKQIVRVVEDPTA